MNFEELVRETLREEAAEQPPLGVGFADRVLAARRRRRNRRLASLAATTTAAVVAIAVGVPLLDSDRDDVRPASVFDRTGTAAHPDQSPPRDLIGAGNEALAAYYTESLVKQSVDHGYAARTYWLLDPKTATYKKDTRWSFVAVAPGMKTAAVLERNLPASRIGLLDLATRKVARWIPVGQGVGGLAYSYDGSKLVATAYGQNPDLRERVMATERDEKGERPKHRAAWNSSFGSSSRIGFSVIDVAMGRERFRSRVSPAQNINGREDFAFSRDGALVYSLIVGTGAGMQQFYDLSGSKVAAPANERHLRSDIGARLSPDGRLAGVGFATEARGKSWSKIVDPSTGKEITRVRGAELLAWADGHRLIAWERTAGSALYKPRLVLVTIGSDKVVPLSGTQELGNTFDPKNWQPVFAER